MTDPRVDLAANVAEIRGRIADAASRSGRNPDAITLIAAAKTVGTDALVAVLAAGVVDLGENRTQELLAKAPLLADGPVAPVWHFIGALQRNKVRALAPWVQRWHTIDRLELAETVARHAPGARVLVEVNLGDESAKAGCAPDDVPALVDAVRDRDLVVEGLMAVPPHDADPRRWFASLRELAAQEGLPQLSMGMSHDYEIAVEEGATMVRVGRALFGERAV
ncbi:MAG: YggS family pyridoxal phosphate-dependent enzyme [Actinobacteria bacterium]|nr:YggS family pyridoxal phosphate-dependent enzyme [Actinomycetota bacterium]